MQVSKFSHSDSSEVSTEVSNNDMKLCSLDAQEGESFPNVSKEASNLFESQIQRLKIVWDASQANMEQAEVERLEHMKKQQCGKGVGIAGTITGSAATGGTSITGFTYMVKGCADVHMPIGQWMLHSALGTIGWILCGFASIGCCICTCMVCSLNTDPSSKERTNVNNISRCIALMNISAPLFEEWKALKESLHSDTSLNTKKITVVIENYINVLDFRKMDNIVCKKLTFIGEIFELIENSQFKEDPLAQNWKSTIQKLIINDANKVFRAELEKEIDPCPELIHTRATVKEYIDSLANVSFKTEVNRLLDEINQRTDEIAPFPVPVLPLVS